MINPEKIEDRLVKLNKTSNKKLSILVIGHDSLSRLNFFRNMPLSKSFLDKRDFLEFRGYNKIGDNTFPNLMALLTGYNESWSFEKCNVYKPFGLDDCPFIWKGFRDVGYVTASGEEDAAGGTFTYSKKVIFHTGSHLSKI